MMSLYCPYFKVYESGVAKCSLGGNPSLSVPDQICKTKEKHKKCPLYLKSDKAEKELVEWAIKHIYLGDGTDYAHNFGYFNEKDGKLYFSKTYTVTPWKGTYCNECNEEIEESDKDIDSYNFILEHARFHLEKKLKQSKMGG